MLHEALKYKAALNRFAAEQFQDCPSELDWQDAAWLHEFLEQFSDATKAFSADRHPTAHMFVKMMMAVGTRDRGTPSYCVWARTRVVILNYALRSRAAGPL